jgi:Protein of unknown function (DUF2934)
MKVAVKKSTTKNANANRGESAVDLQEQISRRAYELYERRGREHGHEVEDWLQAEAELAEERNKWLAAETAKKDRKPRTTAPRKAKSGRLKKSSSSARIKTEEAARNGN